MYLLYIRIWFLEIFFKCKRIHTVMIVLNDFTKYFFCVWYWKVLLSLSEFVLSKLHYKLPTFNHSFMRSVGVSLYFWIKGWCLRGLASYSWRLIVIYGWCLGWRLGWRLGGLASYSNTRKKAGFFKSVYIYF